MRAVNIHEAKTHLSRLADRAAEGEAVHHRKEHAIAVDICPRFTGIRSTAFWWRKASSKALRC